MAYPGFEVIEIKGIRYRKYTTGTIAYIPPITSKYSEYSKEPAVYKVVDNKTGKIYIGSTVNMRNRVRQYQDKDLTKEVFKGLKANDLTITVLEYCPGIPENDRLIKEYQYIKDLNTFYPMGNNKQCPITKTPFDKVDINTYNPFEYVTPNNGRYDKERYERNKERISLQRKARYQAKNK